MVSTSCLVSLFFLVMAGLLIHKKYSWYVIVLSLMNFIANLAGTLLAFGIEYSLNETEYRVEYYCEDGSGLGVFSITAITNGVNFSLNVSMLRLSQFQLGCIIMSGVLSFFPVINRIQNH